MPTARVYGTFASPLTVTDTRTAILATAQVLGWKLVRQNDSVVELKNPRHPWVEGKMEVFLAGTGSGTTLNIKMSAFKLSSYERRLEAMMSTFLTALEAQMVGVLPHEGPPDGPPR